MSEDLVLYTNPMSRGRIARWMMEEVGRPYANVVVPFGKRMKTSEYLALNPMGKVPTLVHGKTVVTEGAAICAYLADAFPEAGLAPPLAERGAYYRWLFFAAGPLEQAWTNKSFGFELPEGGAGRSGYGSLERVLDTLEKVLAEREYIAGEAFSAADVYVGAQLGFGIRFGMFKDRTVLERYWERISKRPAAVRAAALDDADVPPEQRR